MVNVYKLIGTFPPIVHKVHLSVFLAQGAASSRTGLLANRYDIRAILDKICMRRSAAEILDAAPQPHTEDVTMESREDVEMESSGGAGPSSEPQPKARSQARPKLPPTEPATAEVRAELLHTAADKYVAAYVESVQGAESPAESLRQVVLRDTQQAITFALQREIRAEEEASCRDPTLPVPPVVEEVLLCTRWLKPICRLGELGR